MGIPLIVFYKCISKVALLKFGLSLDSGEQHQKKWTIRTGKG